MTASFPGSTKSFTTKVDIFDDVMAVDVNGIQDEVVAIENNVVVGPASSVDGNIVVYDGTVGKKIKETADLSWNKTNKTLTIIGTTSDPTIQGVGSASSSGIYIHGGDSAIDAGRILLEAGDGLDTMRAGGEIEIYAGVAGTESAGGFVNIYSGDGGSTIGDGGSINIMSGSAPTDGDGGNINITPGAGAGGGADGIVTINGDVVITTGATGTFTTVDLKTVTVTNGIITSIV